MSQDEPERLFLELKTHLSTITREQQAIRQKLTQYSDGKKLKGDELWLHECHLLLSPYRRL